MNNKFAAKVAKSQVFLNRKSTSNRHIFVAIHQIKSTFLVG